ncbi:MAG: hypothetical protein O2970_11795 [Proteobacteria bacterium]|nr:hypothetical protein [Pseudomonadota bacterium]
MGKLKMAKFAKQLRTSTTMALAISAAVGVSALLPDIASAGTGGAEFAAAESKVAEIVGGTGGKLFAGLSLAFAVIASILKFNPVAVASAFGVGLLASGGVAAVQTSITGVI